ncbi:DoxX family protein [Chlamydiota bacterium]
MKVEGTLKDVGLLILRLGIGSAYIIHGFPKFVGGEAVWEQLGRSMEIFSINFWYSFWGFLAASSELFGGMFLILGIFIRPFCALLAGTMFVAACYHLNNGEGFLGASHAFELAIVFVSLIFLGPGSFSSVLVKKEEPEKE